MAPPSVCGPTGPSETPRLDQSSPLTHAPGPIVEDDATITTVDELVRRRARKYSDHIVVSYPSEGIQYVNYTMQQLDVYAYRAAKAYECHLPMRASSEEKPMTVAILGPSNMSYLITMLALTKLGHTILFLSPRISQEAVDNLLNTTGAVCLLVDRRYSDTAEAARQFLGNLSVLDIVQQSEYEFPIEVHADTKMGGHLDAAKEAENYVYIIHSSGSTGLPKPIYQTHRAAVANYSVSMNMRAFITLPLYHNHGICNLYRAIYSGKSIHMYNADLPLTHDYLVKTMRAHGFEIFYGVPYALKLLSESEEGLRLLSSLKIVMYGGSAMPDDLGNTLVSHGINLVGHYGATEVGQLMTSFRPANDTAWNYVRETPKLSPFLKWVPRGDLFECCVLKGWPAQVASNQDDGSYMTKDLFEPHPTIPQAWKYVARRDDTLNLETGEMFNPVGTEGAIRSSKYVTEAVIFGAGRPVPGVLVIPSENLRGRSDDEILEAIWPVVESACRDVEAYARISKSMIKFLPIGCDYPRTDKGSVVRQAFYRTYAEEINETYDRAETGHDLKRLDSNEIRGFVSQSLVKALAKDVQFDENTDFFLLGLDSLQAIQIRSDILKNIDIRGHRLSQTVVFDHPSIEQLSAYLSALSSDQEAEVQHASSVASDIRDLIEKYAQKPRPTHASLAIVVTGASGSLGAHVVAKLIANPDVSKVYCLVRANSDEDAAKRVKASMMQRRIYHDLPLVSRRKVVSLAAELSDEKLGLSPGVYNEVVTSLNSVIHCAWSVNFNMRLSSFEKSNVAGVANLISLCEATRQNEVSKPPATFNFCSSVSTVAQADISLIPESLPKVEWAQNMGYAQSKTVAEHLCARAADAGITARVLRVGQIVADTQHGIWNSTEAIPLILQTAKTIGALPKLRETPSWLPVDTTAAAVAQISLSNAGSVFTHVSNPKTFDWTSDLLPALRRSGLSFEELEPQAWVNRLRNSSADPVENPPIKLVNFFAYKYDKAEFGPSKSYATDTACSLSPALANAHVLDQKLVDSFVSYFTAGPWAQASREQGGKQLKMAIFIAGPCGSGKSTLATSLACKLRVPFVEGDYLHSRESVEKMAAAQALTDADRKSWLQRLGQRAVEGVVTLDYQSVVVSCSALRESYRDALRNHVGAAARVIFLDLQCERESLVERMSSRHNHYMPESLVESQLSAYEPPAKREVDVLPLDAGASPEAVLEEALWSLQREGLVI